MFPIFKYKKKPLSNWSTRKVDHYFLEQSLLNPPFKQISICLEIMVASLLNFRVDKQQRGVTKNAKGLEASRIYFYLVTDQAAWNVCDCIYVTEHVC